MIRRLKFYLLSKGVDIKTKQKVLFKKYFEIEGIEIPLNIQKALESEYKREDSPISENIKLPPRLTKKKKKERRKSYKDYLSSYKWIAFRNKIKNDRGSKCEKCGTTKGYLQGHHLTYERLFNELPEDILIVCKPCHELIHKRKF